MIVISLFDTAIGVCGIAFDSRGIAGLQLPESSTRATKARLVRRFRQSAESSPDPIAAGAIGRIAAVLEGDKDDLCDIPLILEDVAEFDRRVYGIARRIAPGSTMTYGGVAAALELPGAAQAVGQALGRNPIPLIVPCHRVLAASGQLGGFSAYGGRTTKSELLRMENTPGFSDPRLF